MEGLLTAQSSRNTPNRQPKLNNAPTIACASSPRRSPRCFRMHHCIAVNLNHKSANFRFRVMNQIITEGEHLDLSTLRH